ncbi:unnamed protein product [Nezara viridula]|uniref:Uncharacterized protein n=1 Tax=Nezara viridula TaxID=85310 RepID=A0A9P0E8G4_NEZVI|nr:unnamed protein product [Nezara viridula]
MNKDKEAYICFVDLIKTLNRVNVQDVQKALREKDGTLGFWKALLNLFAKCRNFVRTCNNSVPARNLDFWSNWRWRRRRELGQSRAQ